MTTIAGSIQVATEAARAIVDRISPPDPVDHEQPSETALETPGGQHQVDGPMITQDHQDGEDPEGKGRGGDFQAFLGRFHTLQSTGDVLRCFPWFRRIDTCQDRVGEEKAPGQHKGC